MFVVGSWGVWMDSHAFHSHFLLATLRCKKLLLDAESTGLCVSSLGSTEFDFMKRLSS